MRWLEFGRWWWVMIDAVIEVGNLGEFGIVSLPCP